MEHGAVRLSSGQSVVLSLALRFAINSMFTGGVSVLVLDEPTLWQDKEGVSRIYDVLDSCRKAESGQSQILLITHEQELMGICDVVHRL